MIYLEVFNIDVERIFNSGFGSRDLVLVGGFWYVCKVVYIYFLSVLILFFLEVRV